MKDKRTLRVAGAVAALAAATATVAGGTVATADVAKGPFDQSIEIKGNKAPRFDAPEDVPFGVDLQIVNKTDPAKIGPHTFSVVEKNQIPKGRDEIKRCAKLKDVCKDIAQAHEVNLQTGEIGEPNVENGAPGWDATFNGSEDGDSWATQEEGETTSRQLLVGGKMFFLCAVHPEMHGKIKVLPIR